MDATNEGIRDYYLLPGIDMTWENLRVAEANGIYLDAYRFDTLDYFLRHGRARETGGGCMNDEVKMIPIDRIRILNPRHRDQKKFELIVQSIKNLGLKKPIQVSLRSAARRKGRATIWFAARAASKRSSRWATRKFRPSWFRCRRRIGCCAVWWKTWRGGIPRRWR